VSDHGPAGFLDDSKWLLPLGFVAALLTMAASLMVPLLHSSDADRAADQARQITGSDPERGLELMKRYGCAACHVVPGLKRGGHVGPSLAGFGGRPTIGRHAQNTSETLVKWIIYPPGVDPTSTMPGLGVSRADALAMAAYLYTLK
jgi:cytochrome c2